MANDMAKKIYQLARDDRDLDRCELKEAFRKKIRLDSEILREQLKKIILSTIKSHPQPTFSAFTLSSSLIRGGTASLKWVSNTSQEYKDAPQHSYLDIGNYGVLLMGDARILLEEAIIPLDLKWTITPVLNLLTKETSGNIMISWAHWGELDPKNE